MPRSHGILMLTCARGSLVAQRGISRLLFSKRLSRVYNNQSYTGGNGQVDLAVTKDRVEAITAVSLVPERAWLKWVLSKSLLGPWRNSLDLGDD